jgi:uncharacterized protein
MKTTNRLSGELSPYLLQHAHNPVDWYPWSREAMQKAVEEDKPIFLSIGYSACHWCHVMERESFENQAIADVLNQSYVPIKVDREERPDLDDIYMDAVQLISGGGGWPMSVFLDTQLRPFFGGTYFPPESRHGRKGFREILMDLAEIWKNDRQRIESATIEVFKGMSQEIPKNGPMDATTIAGIEQHACDAHATGFDPLYGGFGGAPKFPPSLQMLLMLGHEKTHKDGKYRHIITRTLDAMASGGIYDHVGGGFCRYAVDERWQVPHFEKMLYDNALLAKVYLEAYRLYRNKTWRVTALETLDYVLRDMKDETHAFHSARDADSDGREGVFYLWSFNELKKIFETDADAFIQHFNVRENGNFVSNESYHSGLNILYCDRPEKTEDIRKMLKKLFEFRNRRLKPAVDDKIIVAWNALMISALATAAQVTGQKRRLMAAEKAADFIVSDMFRNGQLYRIYRKGVVKQEAMLEDWALFGNACLDLYATVGSDKWLDYAGIMAQNIVKRFEENGVLYLNEDDADHIIVRKQSLWDTVIPSGASAATLLFHRLGKIQNNTEWKQEVQTIIQAHARILLRAPGSMSVMAGVAGALT